MLNKVIGGEFDIDLRIPMRGPMDASCLDSVYRYSSGRSALYHVLLDVKKRTGRSAILLPDYLCSSIVVAARKAGVDVLFYPLNESLEIDAAAFGKIYRRDSAVLLINYFGLVDVQNQASWVRSSIDENAVLIEDDVQAYFEFVKDLGAVDYKFTSLRKTFACPDGGLVKTRSSLDVPTKISGFYQYKLAGGLLKSLRRPGYYDDSVYLELFECGEAQIDEDIESGMSEISVDIISRTDVGIVAESRRQNAKKILSGIGELGIRTLVPIGEGKIPLFVPVRLNRRDEVRCALFADGIYCPVHWPIDNMPVKKGSELAECELSIIVDQRYSETDMARVLSVLRETAR